MQHQPYLFLCESPFHVGTGTEASDYIDNRIQRDSVTQYPKIEGSSFRGALREAFERLGPAPRFVRRAFGPAPEDTEQQKGALKTTSLRMLLFPVATPKGTTAWVTCRRALEDFKQEFMQRGEQFTYQGLNTINPSTIQAVDGSGLELGQKRIVLMQHLFNREPLTVTVQHNNQPPQPLTNWLASLLFPNQDDYFQEQLKRKIVVVSDDVFGYLVRFHTDVHTGNRINHQTGVVDEGKLFTTEYLPHYTVLTGWIETWPEFTGEHPRSAVNIMNEFRKTVRESLGCYIQVGGKSSIGKGIGRIIFIH